MRVREMPRRGLAENGGASRPSREVSYTAEHREASGAAILAAVALHAGTWLPRATDPIYPWTTAFLALIGLILIAWATKGRQPG